MALISQSVDRISALPDALLCHILSYVPTEQSVQTSVLSKRWLHVWTDLPNIDIDDFILWEPTLVTDQSVYASFTNFMTTVFNRAQKAPLCKFTLKSSSFDAIHVNEWILAAVRNRVGELVLSITRELPFRMCCGLFAYKELVTLKLGKNFVLKVPNGTFCFPSLKDLRLDYVIFDDASIHKLITSCPVLEELRVEHCYTKKWDTVVFSSPTLMVFVINTLSDTKDDHNCDFKLIVDAPSLEVLNCTGYLATKGYCFKNLSSLIQATLDVAVNEERANVHYASELFMGVGYAKTITLTGHTLEVFHLCLTLEVHSKDCLPIFTYLRKLELGGNLYCAKTLLQLLVLSPNLEVLVVDEDLARKGDLDDFYWGNTVVVPECLSLHLKVVEIWGFDDQRHAAVGRFIRYILSTGGVLTKISASLSKSQVTKVEVNDRLLVYLSSLGI